MFIPLCLVLCSSLTQALPVQYRFEPLAREISLAKLLDEKQTFTRAALNYYLDIFNDYKDYVPKEIKMIFAGLSESTKNEMVATVNEIESGRVKIPNDIQKIIDYIEKRTPQLGQNVDKAMDELMSNLNELHEPTKAEFKKWWSRVFEAVSVPPGQLANCLADLIADFKESYDKASPTIKSDVRTVWPEAYNLLESAFATNFAAAARKFADGGLSMDIHLLSADAPYPPPAPKVKIASRARHYEFNGELGTNFD